MGCQEWDLTGIRGGGSDVGVDVENGNARMDPATREVSGRHK